MTHEHVLQQVCKLWPIEFSSITLIRDVMNAVYQGRTSLGHELIIRLVASERRSMEQVQAEIAWLEYLYPHNLPICQLMLSQNSTYMEVITDAQQTYYVSCFFKQQGHAQIATTDVTWGPALFEDMGRFAATLHQLTEEFVLPKLVHRHSCIQERPFHDDYYALVDNQDVVVSIKRLLHKLSGHSKQQDFMLLHADLKQDNFFYLDSGELFVYDFDQSCYAWTLYDLVVPYFFNYHYPLCRIDGADADAGKRFIDAWMQGYGSVRSIDESQWQIFNDLCSLREALIYLIVKKIEPKLDVSNNPMMTTSFDSYYREAERRFLEGYDYLG